MALSRDLAKKRVKRTRNTGMPLWWDRLVAIVALINFTMIVFDLTYIPLRDFWLQRQIQFFVKIGPIEREIPETPIKLPIPPITPIYDWVKGVEPYRETVQYLQLVDTLERTLAESAMEASENDASNSAREIDAILREIRQASLEMLEGNPFQIANKTGTLERIKKKMRVHVFESEDASAKSAFRTFWTQDYLIDNGLIEQLNFFNQEIAPLIASNYYRPVGENGKPVDNFGLIDFPFFVLFLFDFLLRTWRISRRRAGISWFDAMTWRWTDLPLLVPFFRWSRIVPVINRFDEAELEINLNPVKKQASLGLVAAIADDVTEVVIVNIVNQFQNTIRQGSLAKLFAEGSSQDYIDLNETDETAEIVKLVSKTTVHKVIPQIRPEIEALLQYNIEKAFKQNPIYETLQQVPGLEQLEQQLSDTLVKQLYEGIYSIAVSLVEDDPTFDKLWGQLVDQFGQSFNEGLQTEHSLERLEYLLVALLEEVKVNYVERRSSEDVEEVLEQTRALREVARTS
ncbi:MAG: hypothetical protein AAGG02_18495 [Cyanobacteria bacterium P01_H01_bin.15]